MTTPNQSDTDNEKKAKENADRDAQDAKNAADAKHAADGKNLPSVPVPAPAPLHHR